MEDGRLYQLRGGEGTTVVILRGVPCLLCPTDRHPRKVRIEGFDRRLREAVLSGDAFPAGRAHRFGRPTCGTCRARIDPAQVRQGSLVEEVRIDGVPVTVELRAPLTWCGRCGALQLRPEPRARRQVEAALAAALERAGLRP